jgi:hypothetical protein
MCGLVLAAGLFLVVFGYLYKGRHNLDNAVCGNNLKQIGVVLKQYCMDNREMFPPLSPQPGVLMFQRDELPRAPDIGPLLTCPTIRHAKKRTMGPSSPFDDQSYFYLGYALRNDDDVQAFAKAYRSRIAEGGTFDDDLTVEDIGGPRVLQRLSEGVGPGDVPILIERDLGHLDADSDGRPRGAWVLYLQAGPQFVERGTWPHTEKTQRILAELGELGS